MWRKNKRYARPIGYSPDEFVRILVIDGYFIIELFRKIAYKELWREEWPDFHQGLHVLNSTPWFDIVRLKWIDPFAN